LKRNGTQKGKDMWWYKHKGKGANLSRVKTLSRGWVGRKKRKLETFHYRLGEYFTQLEVLSVRGISTKAGLEEHGSQVGDG